MRFSLPTYQKLIELVRKHPSLYDSTLPEHRDHQLQMEIWQKIAVAMHNRHMRWEDWKKVWKHKRDAFTKKRRELEMCQTIEAASKIRKGPLFDQMSFLVDHLVSRSNMAALMDSPDAYNDIPEGSLDGESESYQDNPEMEGAEGVDEMSDMPKLTWPTPKIQSGSPAIYSDDSNPHVAGNVSGTYVDTESLATTSNLLRASLGRLGNRETPFRPGKYARIKDRDESESKLNTLIELLNESSSINMASIQTLVSKLMERDDDTNIYNFLTRKVKELSEPTQQWMEDEVLKIYMEAKKRDREMRIPADETQALP